MIYTIKPGDTPASVASGQLGSPDRWPALLQANPDMRRQLVRGQMTFHQADWQAGRQIRIPSGTIGQNGAADLLEAGYRAGMGYEEEPPDEATATASTAGQTCNPGSAITQVKPYVYVVQSGDFPSTITTKWGIETGGQGRPWKWHELRRANADDPDGFMLDPYGACVWVNWRAGKKLRIPASWPEPPASMKGNMVPYNPSEFGKGTGEGGTGPGEAGVEPVSWSGAGLESGGSGIVIAALAAAAGLGGWLLVSVLGKKKRG